MILPKATPMTIAVASGKGGTGKTTVSTNLAMVAASIGRRVALLDCDVEAPNCHIFLRPDITDARTVHVTIPKVDEEACTSCGECSEICEFNAVVCVNGKVLTFPELCHGCGGCWLVCPSGAITKGNREVGVVEHGQANGLSMTQGRLRIGEAMSPPLIRQVKATGRDHAEFIIVDAPPGTSCPVIAAVKSADYVCLVTEPTPFGLNDLVLAVGMVRELGIPMGVVINRSDIGDREVRSYCRDQKLPILAEIPDDRRVAEAYARGEIVTRAVPTYTPIFESLLLRIEQEMAR
jgi:MinD superfamily P-loop ATPase